MQLHLVITVVVVMIIGLAATAAAKRMSMNLACEWSEGTGALLPIWTWKQDTACWAGYLSLVILAAIAVFCILSQ